ncbi:MAG: hypothetical protein LBP68_06235 [Acidobacteriota bacterium]|jgi:hypothetical protein|nr:hypothetical protein [Acidobacteriota bacterium]
MGICNGCKEEMSDAEVLTCAGRAKVTYPDGTSLPVVPYDPGQLHFPKWYRCPDCNVAPSGIHHEGCDQEICPRCGGQFVSCDCF